MGWGPISPPSCGKTLLNVSVKNALINLNRKKNGGRGKSKDNERVKKILKSLDMVVRTQEAAQMTKCRPEFNRTFIICRVPSESK